MKTLLYPLFIFLGFFQYDFVVGQYSETISSGRPGFSNGATTVGARTFQVQAGVEKKTLSLDEEDHYDWFVSPWTFRMGILERLEVALLLDYEHIRTHLRKGVHITHGVSSPTLRARVNLIEEQKGLIPTLAVQGGAVLPISMGSEYFKSEEILPFARLMLGYNILDFINLTLNYRYASGMVFSKRFFYHQYLANVAANLTQNFGVMAEFVGSHLGELDGYNLHYGLYYLLNDDLQLDIYAGGHQLEHSEVNPFFINVGVSWRVRL